jgi:hypothetical protein
VYTASGNLQVNAHWIPVGDGVNPVRFGAALLGRANDEVYDAAFSDTATVDDTPGSVDDLMIAQISFTSPSISPGDSAVLQFYREGNHANDTNTGSVDVVAVELLVP